MKRNNRFSLVAVAVVMTALFVVSCNQSEKADDGAMPQIRVGVFNGNGGAQTCMWEAFAACSLDGDMAVRYVTTADIAAGVLDSLDVIVVPGGGGTRQYQNLGEENVRRIQEFVRQGGGAVGICAGAYLFSNTPEYSCLAMNGAKSWASRSRTRARKFLANMPIWTRFSVCITKVPCSWLRPTIP